MSGRTASPFPSNRIQVSAGKNEKKHLVTNEYVGAGNEITRIREHKSRRLSYTDFDSAEYASVVASALPLGPGPEQEESFDHPSRPPTSLRGPSRIQSIIGRKTSLASFVSYPPEVSASRDDYFDEPNRLPKFPPMFTEEFRMVVASSKHPYKHLQETSSVESNETPPFEADRGSPAKASPFKTNSLDVRSSSSSLTMSTTLMDRQKSGIQRPSHQNSTSHQSSNEDDLDATSADLTYHPNSPRTANAKKPMIFERGSSQTGSANLLTVPDKPKMGSLQDQSDPNSKVCNLTSTNNEKLKESKLPDVEKGSYPNNFPRFNNNLGEKNPRPKMGVHLEDGRRLVDFILVYERNQTTSAERQRRYFETNLQQEGLIMESDPIDTDESNKLCFIRVHAPWNTLCRYAEMLHMKMPLRNTEMPEHETIVTIGTGGFLNLVSDYLFSHWGDFNDTEKILIGAASNHVTAQFTRARLEKFLINDPDTFFTATQRIRIIYEIMQKAKCDPDNNKKRGVQWLLKSGVYTAAYPIHDGEAETRHLDTNEPEKWSQRQILKHTWANFNRLFKKQPLNLIRAYFGEKIGFYFAWLGFYTQMLIFPSIVGVICFMMGVFALNSNPLVLEMCDEEQLDPNLANITMCPVCRLPNCKPWPLASGCESAQWNYRFDNESHVFMAVFTLLWATIFMELWKRKEAELAAEWDAYDAEQGDEPTRPEYEARTKCSRISPVTNEEEPHVSPVRRAMWMAASASGVFLLIMTVVGALVALIVVRIAIYGFLADLGQWWDDYKFEIASLIIHVFTFLVVMTLGSIYEPTAHRLTELECPRTQADYLSSYIWKVFIFEILNNFAPILYAAIVRGGCLNEVVQAIAILLLARLLISNAAEVGVPLLKSLVKSKSLGKASVHPDQDHDTSANKAPLWQRDYALNEADLDGVYAEYLEMMVQFGYVTLFVAVFPLAPLICLLNNIVKTRAQVGLQPFQPPLSIGWPIGNGDWNGFHPTNCARAAYLEIRIDATNFTTSFRRPLPARVSGIRIWRRCLNIIIKLSVLCNGAFLAFTSEFIPTMVYRYTESKDGSNKGYMWWSMSRLNTSDWGDYQKHDHSEFCYYRDFRDENNELKLIWWQIMVARLAFFVAFVIFFYFIQWLCDFLVPDVPQHVKLKVDRANFLARQSLYGQESSGTNSAGSGNRRNHSGFQHRNSIANRRHTEATVETMASEYEIRPRSSVANGHLKPKTVGPILGQNGVVMNGNGHVVVDEEEIADDSRWQQENGQVAPPLHPNQLPSPMRNSAQTRNQGVARPRQNTTATSNL